MNITAPRFKGEDLNALRLEIQAGGNKPLVRRSGAYTDENGVRVNPPSVTVRANEISSQPWRKGPDKPEMITIGGEEEGNTTGGGNRYVWFYVPVTPIGDPPKDYHAPNLDVVG